MTPFTSSTSVTRSRSSSLALTVGLALAMTTLAAGCGEDDPRGLASASECQQACDHSEQLCGPTSYDCVQFCLDEQAPHSGIQCALAAATCHAARACYGGQLPDSPSSNGAGNGGSGGSGSGNGGSDGGLQLATRDQCQAACDYGQSLCGPTSYDCVQFCLDQHAPVSGIECALAATTCAEAQACYGGQLPH
jgi:hypothetical protein